MAALFNRRSSAPVTKSSSGIRIPAWAFARRISERSLRQQDLHKEMDESPDSLARKTVQTFQSNEDDSLLLIPKMPLKTTATAAPVPPIQAKPPTIANTTTSTHKDTSSPRLLLKMDVTGFKVEDLHVEVDTRKQQLCLSGMGPRMFKRAFPLPASFQTDEDVARLEASIVVLDDRKSSEGHHYLIIQSNPLRVEQQDQEDDGDDHSSLSSSNLGKLVFTSKKKKTTTTTQDNHQDGSEDSSSVDSSTAGRRSIPIQDETRPPLQIMVPHFVAGSCA